MEASGCSEDTLHEAGRRRPPVFPSVSKGGLEVEKTTPTVDVEENASVCPEDTVGVEPAVVMEDSL